MGTYTEFKCKFRLKKDTPEEIISFLQKTIVERDIGIGDKVLIIHGDVPRPTLNHEFFDCGNWYMLFHSNNFSPEEFPGSKFYEGNGYPIIEIHTEFKNYDSEIDKFIDWISPYIVGRKKKQYLGYWRQEEMDHQFNIYIERP